MMKRYQKIAAMIAAAAFFTGTPYAFAEVGAQTGQEVPALNAATPELS